MTGQSFEQHLSRLDEIAAQLDRPDVPLDRALQLFEEGIARLRSAAAALDAADGRLRELVQLTDGSIELTGGVPLEADGDD